MPRPQHYHAFTPEWFRANLSRLCRAFNAPILGRWIRRRMALRADGRVVDVRTDSIVIEIEPNKFEYTGWTGDVVSQFVYELAKPLWWVIHYWDEWVADRWIPQWSYGFNTLTPPPIAGPPLLQEYTRIASPTTKAFDVILGAEASTLANARSGTFATFILFESDGTNNQGAQVSAERLTNPTRIVLYRTFLNFDTSAMAGDRGQNIPGTVDVTYASLICLPAPASLAPGEVYLTQSTITPTRTSTTIVPSVDYKAIGNFNLATSAQNGTARAVNENGQSLQIIPGVSSANLNVYQWIFTEFFQTEIETYYYPPSLGSYGAHNGLARFCLRHQVDWLNSIPASPAEYASINSITSREQASLTNAYYAPRLRVVYEVGIIVDAFSIEPGAKFGQPEIQAPRQVQLTSIPRSFPIENNRFGRPQVQQAIPPVEVRGFLNVFLFGLPIVPTVLAQGFQDGQQFGTPSLITSVNVTGFQIAAQFGLPVLNVGLQQTIRTRGFQNEFRIGQPFVQSTEYLIRAVGIAPTSRMGLRWYIGHAFPEEVYVSRLQDLPLQYQTVAHEYDGGRIETNVQVCGVRQWRLEYDGLSEADLAILVTHFNKVQGRVGLFPFFHRRDNVVYEDCRYAAFDIPARIKKWSNAVTIVIEREE